MAPPLRPCWRSPSISPWSRRFRASKTARSAAHWSAWCGRWRSTVREKGDPDGLNGSSACASRFQQSACPGSANPKANSGENLMAAFLRRCCLYVTPAHSAIHQNGGFCVRQDLVCHTAEHDCGQPAAPVRSHDNEIAAPVRGRCNNGLIGSRVLHLHRVAGHTGLLGCIGHPTQYTRVFLALLVMFGKVFKCLPLRRSRFWNVEQVERLLDDNYGYFGSHGFRQ